MKSEDELCLERMMDDQECDWFHVIDSGSFGEGIHSERLGIVQHPSCKSSYVPIHHFPERQTWGSNSALEGPSPAKKNDAIVVAFQRLHMVCPVYSIVARSSIFDFQSNALQIWCRRVGCNKSGELLMYRDGQNSLKQLDKRETGTLLESLHVLPHAVDSIDEWLW
jgi:hypothetical protein